MPTKKPVYAVLFSTLIPGLGQMYAGKGERGALILIATIVIGNLNVIWLSLFAQTSSGADPFWGVSLPRTLHDLFAFYGLVFLVWQIWDAWSLTKRNPSI